MILGELSPASLNPLKDKLPEHGGNLPAAAKAYNIPLSEWVDLSTGINPEPYPVPAIPAQAFNALPYLQDDFIEAVQGYYQQANFLAVAGTQTAIQVLPEVFNQNQSLRVLLPSIGYQEHKQQWLRYGSVIQLYRSDTAANMSHDIQQALQANPDQHLVVINPNNPSTVQVGLPQLLQWSSMLGRHAHMIVDEAFIDISPEGSLLSLPQSAENMLPQNMLPQNIVVLRSFGKFFGLAGIRLGFVFSSPNILKQIQQALGIWQVNGPAQFIATQALNDTPWQTAAKQNIQKNTQYTEQTLNPLMATFKVSPPLRHALFLSYPMSLTTALFIYNDLAKHGILTRVVTLDNEQALLRVGSIDHLNMHATARLHDACEQLRLSAIGLRILE